MSSAKKNKPLRQGRVLSVDDGAVTLQKEDKVLHLRVEEHAARPGDLVHCEDNGLLQVIHAGPSGCLGQEVLRLSSERVKGLKIRAKVLQQVRAYFEAEGFLEIESPLLVSAPGMEVNIGAVKAGQGFLITSPEYSMKRLLVGGLERIFSVARCFRQEESGRYHNTEFTMLEWYRAWSSLDEIAVDTEELVYQIAMSTRGTGHFFVDGKSVDVKPPWRKLSIADAFSLWVGFVLDGHEDAEDLSRKMKESNLDTRDLKDWDDLFYLCFVERIEPQLAALDHAVFLVDWPLPLAALAKVNPQSPQWALRFEAYVGGIELANAFDELTNAAEQKTRFVEEQALRKERGLPVYPLDNNFLRALEEGMPPSGGIAMGIDRLAMLAAGADSIRTVSAFVEDEV